VLEPYFLIVFVQEPYFSMDNLQPGRNYSISVKAVSNGIESIERTVFQATRKYRSTGEQD
jgi:hypothetical protein